MRDTTLWQAEKLAGGTPPLLLHAEKLAQSFMRGAHGQRKAGAGEAFWQFRPYQQGDSTRDIDWRKTARSDETFIRQKEREIIQVLWLYRDGTESMNFRSAKSLPTKKEYAEVLLLALSMVALDGGERVGLLGTDLAPQTGYASARRIFDFLPRQNFFSEGAAVASGSRSMMMSDFYFPLEETIRFCESLALRHVRGTLVQVFDPEEEGFSFQGRIKFQDMEGGETLTLSQAESVREEYRNNFLTHQRALADLAQSLGWNFHAVSTQAPLEKTFATLYHDMAGEAA